ncbi:MAG: fibronectin type III domain-containing protein, partial [Candidatus Cryptobacteroides sp.]
DLVEGSFLSFSPAGAFEKGYADGTVGINLSEIQNPSSLTIDEVCDVLVAKPCDYMAESGTVTIDNLFFKRIFSIVKVNVKGVEALNGEKVTSFTLNAPVTLTGRAAVDLSTASISKWNVENQSVTAKYTTDNPVFGGENGLDNTVWFVVNPTTIASGSTVTFSGETENYTFSKEVTLTKDVVFPQGQLAVINLTIGEGNYVAKTAETRIFVEGFDNVETTKTQLQPSETGASGTGVTDALVYEYSSNNTNLRFNNNGHSSTNPYLYLSLADDNLIISNIKISGETALKFSCQAKTNSGSATITINYKESSSDTWSEAGTVSAGTGTFDTVNSIIFAISSEVTSLDVQIVTSGAGTLVDDLVLESFVDTRTTLSVPSNVSVSVDAETPNTLNVSWTAVENASGYEVVMSADGKEDIVKTATESPLAVSSLDYSTTYSVKVKATTTDIENFIESEYSAAVSGITGDKPAGAAEWISTPFANLKAGDKVVIVRTSGTTYAMTNDNGTSAAPSVKAVTISGDKLNATPESNIVWYVDVDGDNKIFNTSSEQTSWLYCTDANNGVRVGTNTNKTFTYTSNYLQHVGTSRYLGVYNNADWRCYTSTTGNIAAQTFAFFVEQTGSSEGGSDPVKLTAPTVICSGQSENSLTFTWAEVANASGYQVSTDGGVNYGATQSAREYTWTGLFAETSYTLYVKAIGDGTSYTDSDAVSVEGTTTASSSEGGETKYFVKVTSTPTDWSGEYLIVYED